MVFVNLYEVVYHEYKNDDTAQSVIVAAEDEEKARAKVKKELCQVTNFFANNDGYVVCSRDLNQRILR